MDPKYEDSDDDTGETVRSVAMYATAPGDLKFRQSVAASFRNLDNKLQKIETRLTKIEERQLPRATIAEIAQKEMAVLVDKVETLSKVVWGLAGATATALVVLAISRVFK